MEAFPLLVKLIDAQKDLSVQVHPADGTALRDRGEAGKAEMWYIVDCGADAAIYLGFSRQLTPEELRRRAADGTICQVLNRVPVKKGDTFFIQPGTIHAICAGVLVAEIQQNSNTTFRVYDYQRRDAAGNLRPLHLERAAAVLHYAPSAAGACRPLSVTEREGCTEETLCTCPYFTVERLDIRTCAALHGPGDSFRHLLCVEGEGAIVHGGVRYPLRQGDSYLLPAALGDCGVEGRCRVLLSHI